MTTPIKPPADNRLRVNRGGAGAEDSASWVRAAYLDTSAPRNRYYDLGFRTTQTGCRQQPLRDTP